MTFQRTLALPAGEPFARDRPAGAERRGAARRNRRASSIRPAPSGARKPIVSVCSPSCRARGRESTRTLRRGIRSTCRSSGATTDPSGDGKGAARARRHRTTLARAGLNVFAVLPPTGRCAPRPACTMVAPCSSRIPRSPRCAFAPTMPTSLIPGVAWLLLAHLVLTIAAASSLGFLAGRLRAASRLSGARKRAKPLPARRTKPADPNLTEDSRPAAE